MNVEVAEEPTTFGLTLPKPTANAARPMFAP